MFFFTNIMNENQLFNYSRSLTAALFRISWRLPQATAIARPVGRSVQLWIETVLLERRLDP